MLDLVAYMWHRANHTWTLLWRFHAVHHSDIYFDASTAFRFHPGELLISLGVRLVAVTVTGLPILGLIAFEVLYGFSNVFVHSDIRMTSRHERRLGWVIVTPSLHRMHHSERPRSTTRISGPSCRSGTASLGHFWVATQTVRSRWVCLARLAVRLA